jgi:hypothetical protein
VDQKLRGVDAPSLVWYQSRATAIVVRAAFGFQDGHVTAHSIGESTKPRHSTSTSLDRGAGWSGRCYRDEVGDFRWVSRFSQLTDRSPALK